MTVLSARPFRAVALETRGDELVVVKRFHHPNPLLARFDGARARRELAALELLERAGLPVPRPLGVRRGESGWELSLAAVPGARTLQELLEGGTAPPGGWKRLLGRLGRLLARFQVLGWEHGDLHAGNVLVGAAGEPWLIDFQHLCRVAPDSLRCLDELVECAALAREHLPARLRARFLLAWRAALPAELRPGLRGTALAGAVESRARARRSARVRAGLGRWRRDSSRVRALARDGARVWLRRDLAPEVLAGTRPEGWLVLRGEREELRARWLGAARLLEHGLAVLRPAAFAPGSHGRGRGAWAAFEPPRVPAREPADLLASLAERGLVLLRPQLVPSAAGVCFSPPREPQDFVEP